MLKAERSGGGGFSTIEASVPRGVLWLPVSLHSKLFCFWDSLISQTGMLYEFDFRKRSQA